MEEKSPINVTEKEILKDFDVEFQRASSVEGGGSVSPLTPPTKPIPKLSPIVVRMLVNGKNGVAIKALSKGLDSRGQSIVREFYGTKDKEVEVYRLAAEETLSEYASPETIELINKYAGSPIVAVLELELEKFFALRGQLAAYRTESSSTDEGLKAAA